MLHFRSLRAIILPLTAAANLASAQQAAWTHLPAMPADVQAGEQWIRPARFAPFQLDDAAARAHFNAAPMESFPIDFARGLEVHIPRPDGGLGTFRCFESPVMEPGLAAQFPQIKTYVGQGVDDPAAIVRFDLTPSGFHAMVLSPDGDYWVDPYTKGDINHYASYYRRDYAPRPFEEFLCGAEGEGQQTDAAYGVRASGTTLRTFRLACAATGEYTAFHGGTVASGQAAIVTAVNRVTGVYEREFTIRLVLVANNSNLVYTNATTDPYTNSNGSTMLGQNQTNITSVIGSANYDIGHVFSTGGGGVAGLGVVCSTNNKARGVTGLTSPTGDPFYIDYVCHEMGHQFNAGHTFNGTGGSCASNRSGTNAYEPGSGSSIMSYSGICGADNLQTLADVMFHSRSHDQVISFVAGISGCGTSTPTGNSIPVINAGSDYNVPIGTPFTATAASASDANGDTLSFSWEERNLGVAQALTDTDNGTSPILRPFSPVASMSRTFPRLPSVLSGSLVAGEKYPAVARTMNLRCTVRDNRAAGGGVQADNIVVNIRATAVPFAVTSPNTAINWPAATTQTVTWNVAGTTAAPFNAANVRILLSTDGGNTYPTTLIASTPNDGSEAVTVPTLPASTSFCRVRVEPIGQIFFDVSNTNFAIQAAPPPPAPTNVAATPNLVCAGGTVTLTATVGAGEEVDWYITNCGATFVGTGSPLEVSVPATQIYRARARRLSDGAVSACVNTSVLTVSGPPAAPTSAGVNRSGFCASDAGSITLSVSGGTGGSYVWFADACGGSPIGNAAEITIDSPTVTTTYFARLENACGASDCVSVPVHVAAAPTDPASASSSRTDFCSDDPGTITLTATGGSGTTLRWYASACGGTPIGSGNDLVIESPTASTTYFARWEATCGTSQCASAAVNVQPAPAAPTQASASRAGFCADDPGTITLTAEGGSGDTLRWFASACDGTSIGTGNGLVIDSPAVTTTYFARWENACTNSACAQATVTVTPLPAIASVTITGSAPFIRGTDGSVRVSLAAPAPSGGSTVSVTSPAFQTTPVSIAAGETSGSAPVVFTQLGVAQTASASPISCSSGAAVSDPFDVILLAQTYVSTTGDDANRGDTPESPVRHITLALARTAPAGAVALAAGEYSECVSISSPVTITGVSTTSSLWTSACEGVPIVTVSGGASAELFDLSLIRTAAPGGRAMLIEVGASASATRCAFTGHSAAALGGAIEALGPISLRDCTLAGNTATGGGAIATHAPASLVNCTLSGNAATDAGGAILILPGGAADLDHCTIAFNSAASGGGIAISGGTATLESTIVSDNTAGAGPDLSGALSSTGFNLIGNSAGVTGLIATDLIDVSPLLGTLTDNGGPTPTHALGAGSPAIDAANPGVCDPAFDQRGQARPFDGNGDGAAVCDIGAFESLESATPCPADFNQDGGVDGGDVDAFFLAWEAGDAPADVNQDGGVDGGDVTTFFEAWEAGGC